MRQIMKYGTISLLLFFIAVIFIQCNQDLVEIEKESLTDKFNYKNNIKKITEGEIPKGVIPLIINNEEELDNLIASLDNVKLNSVTEKGWSVLKTRSESPGSNSHTTNYGSYDILITVTWAERGKDATVNTTNASTWLFSSWEQNTGVAIWENDCKIKYSVTGTIKVYVIVSWELIEISREHVTINGYVNV